MAERFDHDADANQAQSYELLEELELNHPEDVQHARELAAIKVRAGVVVRPANVAERTTTSASGTSREIQSQGLSGSFAVPIPVGSMFHLTFDRAGLDLAPVLAVCDKCVMLSDTAFEAHFHFLQSIELPDQAADLVDEVVIAD